MKRYTKPKPNTSIPKKIKRMSGPMRAAIRGAKNERRKFQIQSV